MALQLVGEVTAGLVTAGKNSGSSIATLGPTLQAGIGMIGFENQQSQTGTQIQIFQNLLLP